MAKQDEWARITLRIPPELHAKLMEAAKATSMNAEIISRLEQTFNLRIGDRVSPDGERYFMTKEEVEEILDRSLGRLKNDLIHAGLELGKKPT
ncbi:toxin-antitoxin system HicB family antitoxin [Labrys neptuniae]